MVAAILERRGEHLVHNRAGANMAGGIAATLLHEHGDRGLFEVDEFWLARLVAELQPRATLLANLFRDQLDRYGELETIAERWAQVAGSPQAGRLVLNADDPTVADLGREREDALFFGVEDDGVALAAMQHASDATHCRQLRCAVRLRGALSRPSRALSLRRVRRTPAGAADPRPDVRLQGISGATFTLEIDDASAPVRLPLPGLYNVYNALAAAALATALGAPLDEIVTGLEAVRAAFGRAETRARRGPRRLDHAREEPRRRERGPADARARARRARRAGDPQRPDRRRSRRELDLGRGLRGARRRTCAVRPAVARARPRWRCG